MAGLVAPACLWNLGDAAGGCLTGSDACDVDACLRSVRMGVPSVGGNRELSVAGPRGFSAVSWTICKLDTQLLNASYVAVW